MATIHVDGKEYEVNGADNLLEACLSLGLDIPYFCWHPALGSVGACRQCAVKQYQNAEDTRGRPGDVLYDTAFPMAPLFPLTTKKRNSSVKVWSSG